MKRRSRAKMAQPSSPSSFLQLPREVRDLVYKEYFGTLSVIVHHGSKETRIKHRLTRISSHCNILRVCKQFSDEARPYLLSHTTFHFTPNSQIKIRDLEPEVTTSLQHIVLIDRCASGSDGGKVALSTMDKLAELLYLQGLPGKKFPSITFDWCFVTEKHDMRARATTPICPALSTEGFVRFIRLGIECAETFIFRAKPNQSASVGRVCTIKVEHGRVITIHGLFMRDLEDIVSTLCKLLNFDASMTCVLTKTFVKPATKVMTVDEVRTL